MKKLLLMTAMVLMCIAAWAQDPLISFHTEVYAETGEANTFTLVIGGTERGYIDVDCGYGAVEYELVPAVFDADSQSITGTTITCHVNSDGNVKIYGDPGTRIDYFNGLGCYITDIEFARPQDLVVLNLDHNLLRKLDCSQMRNLQALYLSDNPFDEVPLLIEGHNPYLQILDISIIENIDPKFDISGCPELRSIDALATYSLRAIDPSNCPHLVRLSIDNTSVATLDVTQNAELRILNISETAIGEIDLSGNPVLQQFFATHRSAFNSDVKIKSIDLSNNPYLVYVFVGGNDLTELDCSGLRYLQDLSAPHNHLRSINIEGCESLINLNISYNEFNFNTLPLNEGQYNEYEANQSPMAMPRSVAVNAPIDLSEAVVRPGTETAAGVFTISRNTPDQINTVPESMYTYADGVITFTAVPADSVFVAFINSAFPDVMLQTQMFKVKSADTYGKPVKALSFNPVYLGNGDKLNIAIGIDGATEATPKTVYLDMGNGELVPFSVTAHNGAATTLDAVKPGYGAVSVYTDGDDVITDLVLADMYCTEVDLNALTELRHLTLTNLELYELDTKWNRCLETMSVTGNHFGSGLDLMGANGWYGKNILRDLNLSNNELPSINMQDVSMLYRLDLSHNEFTEFNFKDAEELTYLNLSHNKFAEVVLNYCSALREADLTNNVLTSIRMPETNVLQRLSIENNRFTLANIPERGPIPADGYTYAPQAVIEIPDRGQGFDLSAQYIEYDGAYTVFTWLTTDGQALTEGVDYTNDEGKMTFLDPAKGKEVYCQITHAGYPQFVGENALRTSVMTVAGLPTNVLASWETTHGGEEVRLTMTATRPTVSVYVDWTGEGNPEQYVLTNETYTTFYATTKAGVEVKMYSYDEEANISVFSMSGATLSRIDASRLDQVTSFTVDNAGLKMADIKLPPESNIRELFLQGNKLNSFDFAPFTSLGSVGLSNNNISKLDVTTAPACLGTLYAANNKIKEVKFDNPNLWGVDLMNNSLTSVDLTGLPSLYQVFLSYNKLSSVNLEGLNELKVLYLDNNNFDFNTLPLRQPNWTLYIYANQPEIKIADGNVVDLSYLSERNDTPTVYYWFYGVPYIDSSSGEITGEALVEGEDYKVEKGVTTFLRDIEETCCLMTNAEFPSMYLITNVITVENAGIADITGDDASLSINGLRVTAANGSALSLYTPDGKLVATGNGTVTAPTAGLYIVRTPNAAHKVKF